MRNNDLKLGRRLDIDALNQAKNKVTLGFKCNAQLKLQLALEAEQKGVSLSQHIETIVTKRNEIKNAYGDVSIEELYTQEQVDIIAQELVDEIAFYEHPKLIKALEMYKGREMSYRNDQGQLVRITIRSIQDVFTIFINHIQLS